ncbi:Uncharacterized protein Rs2_02662 [Raphanus sativus]|nr:Uncharacterized protein Rs2_02662 [Raphanus sativus]
MRDRELRGRPPMQQRAINEWRVKPITTLQRTSEARSSPHVEVQNPERQYSLDQTLQETSKAQAKKQLHTEINEATMLYLSCSDPTEAAARRKRVLAGEARGQTEDYIESLLRSQDQSENKTPQSQQNLIIPQRDQIMQDLQDVTQQYLSCADPVEARARKQRVLEGDAEGLLEKTAERIMAATVEKRRSLSPWERGIRSVSPPAIDFDKAMQPSDAEYTPPPVTRRLEQQFLSDDISEGHGDVRAAVDNPAKLKSIIAT